MSPQHTNKLPVPPFVKSPSSVETSPSMYSQASLPRHSWDSGVLPIQDVVNHGDTSRHRSSNRTPKASSMNSSAGYHAAATTHRQHSSRSYGRSHTSQRTESQTLARNLDMMTEELRGRDANFPARQIIPSSSIGPHRRSESAQYQRSSHEHHRSQSRAPSISTSSSATVVPSRTREHHGSRSISTNSSATVVPTRPSREHYRSQSVTPSLSTSSSVTVVVPTAPRVLSGYSTVTRSSVGSAGAYYAGISDLYLPMQPPGPPPQRMNLRELGNSASITPRPQLRPRARNDPTSNALIQQKPASRDRHHERSTPTVSHVHHYPDMRGRERTRHASLSVSSPSSMSACRSLINQFPEPPSAIPFPDTFNPSPNFYSSSPSSAVVEDPAPRMVRYSPTDLVITHRAPMDEMVEDDPWWYRKESRGLMNRFFGRRRASSLTSHRRRLGGNGGRGGEPNSFTMPIHYSSALSASVRSLPACIQSAMSLSTFAGSTVFKKRKFRFMSFFSRSSTSTANIETQSMRSARTSASTRTFSHSLRRAVPTSRSSSFSFSLFTKRKRANSNNELRAYIETNHPNIKGKARARSGRVSPRRAESLTGWVSSDFEVDPQEARMAVRSLGISDGTRPMPYRY